MIAQIGDVLQSIVKYGSGNDLVGTMARNGNITDTLVGVSRSLQTKEAIRRFNGAGLTAAADMTIGTGDTARKIAKGSRISANNTAELEHLMKQSGIIGSLNQKDKELAGNINKGLGAVMSDSDLAAYLGKKNGKIGYGNLARGYFFDEVDGAGRRQVAMTGAAATAVGVRYLQGGNLTTTAQGERNIAGVPFI